MKWIIETSDATRHIVPLQKHLFKKYVPGITPIYIDLEDKPVSKWCLNVSNKIKELNLKDKNIVFGLADFLPIDRIGNVIIPPDIERLELGYGARFKDGMIDHGFNYLRYGEATPYKNSCQFSIWNLSALLRELDRIAGSPWDFETYPTKTKAGCLKQSVFRYIEESAISKRKVGKVNLCGLRLEDIEEIVDKKFVKPEDIIYSWKGDTERTKETYGKKYERFY